MAEKLKACPFCGGPAVEDWNGTAEFYGHDHQTVTIGCDKCAVSLSIETSCGKDGKRTTGYEFACSCCNDTGAAARSRWNTRTQLPSQGGEAVAIVCGSQVQWLPGAGKVPDRSKLYTHPADQVAEGVVVPLELLEMEWLEQWMQFAAEPIGEECCNRPGSECCGCPDICYRDGDDIISAMHARREELRQLLAKSEGGKP